MKRLLPPALKNFIKKLLYHPKGMGSIGQNSWVMRPWDFVGSRFISIGHNVLIKEHSWFVAFESYAGKVLSPRINIGNGVYIGRYGCIACGMNITIGEECVISEHVYLTDALHGIDPREGPILQQPLILKPIHLGKRVFLGYRAAVMPGVTLGDFCVVAANSVVTKSFPAYSMLAGSPARLIKVFCHETGTWEPPLQEPNPEKRTHHG